VAKKKTNPKPKSRRKADPFDFPFGYNVASKPKRRKPKGGGS
jgi:hypothetical protein